MHRFIKNLFLVTSFVLIAATSGIAGGPGDVEKPILQAPEGKALICLFGPAFQPAKQTSNSSKLFDVEIGGHLVAAITAREYLTFSVPPGLHQISLKGASGRSSIQHEFESGEVVFVKSSIPAYATYSNDAEPAFWKEKSALKRLAKSDFRLAGNFLTEVDIRGQIAGVEKIVTATPERHVVDVEEILAQPPETKALIVAFSPAFITAARGYGYDCKFEIDIDGRQVARMDQRQFVVFAVEPGLHKLAVKVMVAQREGREFLKQEFEAGEVYFLEGQINFSGAASGRFMRRAAADKRLAKSGFEQVGIFDVVHDQSGSVVAVNEVDTLEPAASLAVAESSHDADRGSFIETLSALPMGQSNPSAIAVIIGNRNYSQEKNDAPDVDYALNDASAMKLYVERVLGFKEGNIIYLEDASQADMVNLFGNERNYKGQVSDWVRPGKSDLFIFYSGHGAPSIRDGKGYLLPVDANPNRVELNGYSLETLYSNLAQIPARSFTVILDACFSGASQGGSIVKNASSISLKRVGTVASLPNGTILTAAGLSEVASWDGKARHGLFTRYFLDGVRGEADGEGYGNRDGQVTLGELKGYLESEVTYQARRHYGREQHPQVSGNGERVMAELSPQSTATRR